MANLDQLDQALNESIEDLKETAFFKAFINHSEHTGKIYARYLHYVYNYVRLSSSYTPLAARRMDDGYIRERKWILEHSADELGHELMALKDLEDFGYSNDDVRNGPVPIGVLAWVSFFHYKVSMDNPFSAFGVLYFLEGMAQRLSPQLVPAIMAKLPEHQQKAIRFFKEHGDLDEDHLAQQRSLLLKSQMSEEDQQSIVETIREAAIIKRFMVDQLMLELGV